MDLTEERTVAPKKYAEICRLLKRAGRLLIEGWCAVSVTCLLGRWLIHCAYLERGYQAAGSEYLLILMAFWGSCRLMHYIMEFLNENTDQEEIYRNSEKRQSA